jgi:hypothetical protein
MNRHTQHAIYWVNNPEYSRQHWETVASEFMEETGGDRDRALVLLSENLRNFHDTFRDAVVKPGNVLHDFICMGLEEVDWTLVAEEAMK